MEGMLKSGGLSLFLLPKGQPWKHMPHNDPAQKGPMHDMPLLLPLLLLPCCPLPVPAKPREGSWLAAAAAWRKRSRCRCRQMLPRPLVATHVTPRHFQISTDGFVSLIFWLTHAWLRTEIAPVSRRSPCASWPLQA